jgi:thioredoxin reductase (NADPH)
MTYDIAIVGGGPAGLTAAIKAGTEGLSAVLLERGTEVGGRALSSPMIENVPGWPEGVSGPELYGRLREQAEKFGSEIRTGLSVESLMRLGDKLHLSARSTVDKDVFENVEARSVILAMGEITPRLDALMDYEDRGVSYSCDAVNLSKHRGERVVLVGGGNSCAQLGLSLADAGAKVTIISRSPMSQTTAMYLRQRLANDDRVRVIYGDVEKGYEAAGRLHAIKVVRGEHFAKTVEADQVYVFITGIPPTGWFSGALNAQGYILTGHDVPHEDWPLDRHPFPQESSVPGVFVAGDIRAGATGGVTVALGEGTQAFQWIKREYLPGLDAQLGTPRPTAVPQGVTL